MIKPKKSHKPKVCGFLFIPNKFLKTNFGLKRTMRLSKAAQDGQNIKRPRAAEKKKIFANHKPQTIKH
jgi:hypothetical protein